jgi:hypothetical protein
VRTSDYPIRHYDTSDLLIANELLNREPVLCHYWIVRISRSFSIVIVEQATESLPSD